MSAFNFILHSTRYKDELKSFFKFFKPPINKNVVGKFDIENVGRTFKILLKFLNNG